MKEVAQGIYTKFTELTGGIHNSLYNSVAGRMYLQQAPADAVFPYIVFSFVSGMHEFNWSSRFENVRVQFSIFSTKESAIEVEGIRGYLWTLYDLCTLSMTGYDSIYVRRESTMLTKDDRPAWHCATDYRVYVEKT